MSLTASSGFWQWNLSTVENFFVAVGTIGLAWYTARMARATRKLADESKDQIALTQRAVHATEQQVEISRRASLSSLRPVISDGHSNQLGNPAVTWLSPETHDPWLKPLAPVDASSVKIMCCVANVGNGPALFGALSMFVGPIQVGQPNAPEVLPHPSMLAQGSALDLVFRAARDTPVFDAFANRDSQIKLVVHYEDFAGTHYQTDFDVVDRDGNFFDLQIRSFTIPEPK
jgi:hypothetical protein